MTSSFVKLLLIWGKRIVSFETPGGSMVKATFNSGSFAKDLVASANAFLNGSAGLTFDLDKFYFLKVISFEVFNQDLH
jgi:hypothetical protein